MAKQDEPKQKPLPRTVWWVNHLYHVGPTPLTLIKETETHYVTADGILGGRHEKDSRRFTIYETKEEAESARLERLRCAITQHEVELRMLKRNLASSYAAAGEPTPVTVKITYNLDEPYTGDLPSEAKAVISDWVIGYLVDTTDVQVVSSHVIVETY